MDKRSLEFHIKENDCLGTLATIVDQASQSLKKKGVRQEIAVLARVRDQLMHLHRHYTLKRSSQ